MRDVAHTAPEDIPLNQPQTLHQERHQQALPQTQQQEQDARVRESRAEAMRMG